MEKYQNLSDLILNNQQLELPILTTSEQHQLLVECNDTQTEYERSKCIHQLFEDLVEKNPDALAAVFEGQQVTYRELNQKANQLAHYLEALGVGPEILVGICVERSIEMIVGLLGVLKAGGAYVPLDSTYPKERLAFILEDAAVSVLLTQAHLVNNIPEHKAQVVCLDADWQAVAHQIPENPNSGVTIDKLAYVIYTSGSTGQSKGVLVEHRGLCNLAKAQIEIFNVQPSSRVLQFASFSFDASVSEVFMALIAQATLVLAKREHLLPGTGLIRLLRDEGITVVTLPPSALAVLPEEKLPELRTIIVAGEACPPNLVTKWASGRRFFNAYGPTEVTVCATIAECSDGNQKPPIGRPIANTQVYLLDPTMQSVPIGIPGEIYIAGIGLARGYLNRPELTAERFIPNPFNKSLSTRLYKTGDLARYLPDGNIEFLGRRDNQVKVRGFRIELEEIEAVLTEYSGVRQAVVIVQESNSYQHLVAYVEPNQEQVPTNKELRDYIKKKLPSYMIPAYFLMRESFPLTPNGKIDRRALSAPEALPLNEGSRHNDNSTRILGIRLKQAIASDSSTGTLGEIHALLVAYMQKQVAKLLPFSNSQIDPQQPLNDIGIDSLMSVELIERVKADLEITLPILKLMDGWSIDNTAILLRQQLMNTAIQDHEQPFQLKMRDLAIFSEQSHIFLRRMEQQHIEQAAVVLAKTFTSKEPMAVAMNISYYELLGFTKRICQQVLHKGLSVVAIDRIDGSVVGVGIAEDLSAEEDSIIESTKEVNTKLEPIFSLLDKLDSKYKNLHPVVKGQTVHLLMAGVQESYEAKNIFAALITEGLNLAKTQNFTSAIAEATGVVSQKIFESFGFKTKCHVEYKRFEFNGRNVFKTINSPENCLLVYKSLKSVI